LGLESQGVLTVKRKKKGKEQQNQPYKPTISVGKYLTCCVRKLSHEELLTEEQK